MSEIIVIYLFFDMLSDDRVKRLKKKDNLARKIVAPPSV